MSKNCTICVVRDRKSQYLICQDCLDAQKIVQALQLLRWRESGVEIHILGPNDEGNGPDNEAVEVAASWTNWDDKRFYGRTLLEALTLAVEEMHHHQE